MSFWGKLIVSYLTKLRVVFINQVTDCKLLKIESSETSPPTHWFHRIARVNQ